MFKKWFGSSGGWNDPQNKSDAAPIMEPHEQMNKLVDQIELVEKRIKKIDVDMKNLLTEALTKKKANDKRGALMALRRKKMLEKEIAKLDGQITLLDQQRMMIEATVQDVSVFKALNEGQKAIAQINKQVDVDRLEDIKEKIQEQQDEMEGIRDFFAETGREGQDELMDELEELEAELAKEDMDKIEIGTGAIGAPVQVGAQKGQQPIQHSNTAAAKKKAEEDELRELEMLMS